jgi:hypothetical protein
LAAVGNENNAYGVLLDEAVDTGGASPAGSVARAGSFKAGELIVATGTDPVKVTDTLRTLGIFLEGTLIGPCGLGEQAPTPSLVIATIRKNNHSHDVLDVFCVGREHRGATVSFLLVTSTWYADILRNEPALRFRRPG